MAKKIKKKQQTNKQEKNKIEILISVFLSTLK